MPVAPRYDSPQIQEQGIPGVKVNTDASPVDFGGGPQTGGVKAALGGLGNDFIAIVQKEKQKADDTATKAALNDTINVYNTAMFDPKTGATTKQGKDAFGVHDEYITQYDKSTDEIFNGLKNQDQKDAYNLMRGHYRNQLSADLNRHTRGETVKFEDQTFKSLMETNQNDALLHYTNPDRISEALNVQRKAIESHADQNGWAPETKEAVMTEAFSKTHSGIIDKYLALGQDRVAKKYYEANKDEIGGKYQVAIDQKLESGATKGEAQRMVDKWATDPSLKDQGGMFDVSKALEKTKQIDDIKLRDETSSRLEHYAAVQNAAVREKRSSAYQTIGNLADQTMDLKAIHADPNWSLLSLPEKSATDAYVNDRISGKNTQTDRNVYHQLNQMASTNRAKFLDTDLSSPQYKYLLSEGDFKKFDDMQREAKGGNADKLDGFESDTDVVNSTLILAGIDPKAKNNTDKGKQYQRVKESIDRQAEQYAKINGKKPGNEELRKMAKMNTVQFITNKNWLFSDDKKFYGELGPNDKREDIVVPEEDTKAITAALRKAGKPVTKDAINSIYIRGIKRGG